MFNEVTVERKVNIAETIPEVQRTDLRILESSISSSENIYQLHLKSDGTGRILYSDFPDDFEDFEHEIEVEKLGREIEADVQAQIALQSEQNALEQTEIEEIRRETTSEMITEVFWEQINQTLEDPFFRSFYDGDWGEEFSCEQGTVEELTDFLKLCVLTERTIEDADDFLIVEAETEIDPSGLSDCSYHTERLQELVEIACRYFMPKGFSYDYNDGCYDRMSGYSMNSEAISLSLAEFIRIPSRERMLGMKKLREKLIEMNVTAEKIAKLTAF